MTTKRNLFAILACAMLLACNGSSPTDPSTSSVSGVWTGPLNAYPANEDWTAIRLELSSSGSQVTGTLTSRNGIAHPVTGNQQSSGVYLRIDQLPQQTPCSVNLVAKRVTSEQMEGDLGGRCPNTLFGEFTLTRVH